MDAARATTGPGPRRTTRRTSARPAAASTLRRAEPHELGDVELGFEPRVLARCRPRRRSPTRRSALSAPPMCSTTRRSRHSSGTVNVRAVATGRVLVGHVGRERAERHRDVRVDRPVVALHRPAAGDVDLGPPAVVEVGRRRSRRARRRDASASENRQRAVERPEPRSVAIDERRSHRQPSDGRELPVPPTSSPCREFRAHWYRSAGTRSTFAPRDDAREAAWQPSTSTPSTPTTTTTRRRTRSRGTCPPNRSRLVTWATINGKPRMVVDNKVFRFIPNPTFDPVAKPGVLDEYFRGKRAGDSIRDAFGDLEPINPAYREPEARLKLMDAQRLAGLLHVPDARCRRRRSAVARPRGAARRVPRVQRVDARRLDVQLRGSHLRGAVHLPPGSRARARRKSSGRSTTARTSS